MTLHYNITFNDLMDLQKDGLKNSTYHKRTRIKLQWVTSFLIFFITILFFEFLSQSGYGNLSQSNIATIAAGTIVYFMIFPFYYRTLNIINFKRVFKNNNNSNMLGDWKLTFIEEGITRETENSTSFFKWEAFEKATQDDQHYFLFLSDLQAVIIPKVFSEQEDEERSEFNYFVEKFISPLMT